MYFSKDVYRNTNKGKKIIKFLFDKIRKKPKKFINKNMQNSNHMERSISDYIAGMTDRYAINLYNSLK
jgi:dGTPase